METGEAVVKAAFEIPEAVYYIIGAVLVTHFGSIVTVGGVIMKWVIEYKILVRDITDLKTESALTKGILAKMSEDLRAAHDKIRELKS